MHAALAREGWPFLRPWETQGGCGVPMLAESQASQLYPPALAARAWLDPDLGLFTLVQLHVLATGLFMLLLGREIGLGLAASVLAAVAWMGGGFVVTHLDIPPMLFEAAWLPAAAAAFARSVRTGRRAPLGAAGLALGCMLLAGHFQVAAYGLVFLAGWCALALPALDPDLSWRRRLGALLVALGIAVALAWSQLGATAAFLPRTNRGELGGELWLSWSPLQAVTLVQPFLLGVGTRPLLVGRTPPALSTWWGAGVYWETALYVGLAPLVLACATWPRRFDRLRAVLWGTLAVSLLLAAGKHVPGGSVVWGLPLWGAFRFPARVLVVAHLCLALLAGLGLERVARLGAPAARRWARRLVVAVAAFLMLLAAARVLLPRAGLAPDRLALARATLHPLDPANRRAAAWGALSALALAAAGSRRRRWAPWALVVITAADLTVTLRQQQALVAPEFYLRPPVAPLACDADGPWRYFSDARYLADPVDHQLDLLPASFNLRTRCSTVDFRASLYDQRFARYLAAVLAGYTDAAGHVRVQVEVPLLARAGVRDLLRREPAEGPGLALTGRAGPTWAYRLENAVPVLRRVARARVAPDARAAWDLVRTGAVVPADEVVLEGDPAGAAPPGSGGTLRVLAETRDTLEAETTGPGRGWIVRAQTWAPGWRAWVDGRAAPVRRADFLFQAVEVPAGNHRVRFEYREAALAQGAVTALLGLAACAALAWRDRSR